MFSLGKLVSNKPRTNLDDFVESYERLMLLATREGLPGFAAVSDLTLPPGSRALHKDRPCVIKAHLQDRACPSQSMVIVRYEQPYESKYVFGRLTVWGLAERADVFPWRPRRPGQ